MLPMVKNKQNKQKKAEKSRKTHHWQCCRLKHLTKEKKGAHHVSGGGIGTQGNRNYRNQN